MMHDTEFWNRFTAQYGDTVTARLRAALDEPASVSIRLNPAKTQAVPDGKPVPWCSTGWWLAQRPAFTFDPLFHAGAYYVQEAGSMFLEQALRQHMSHVHLALDLCAAPGGKSTLLRSLMPHDAWLVSNEPIGKRAQVLAENIVKWGHPHCVVTQNYPKDFARLDAAFDLIVADVPCSGEGMFRREAEAVAQWSPQLVEQCASLQRSIIEDVWPALRPGGLLIYSTCTFNRHEDEDNVEWICRELDAELLTVECDPAWGVVEGRTADGLPLGYHLIPGMTHSEGFFLAALRKSPASLGNPPSPLGERVGVRGLRLHELKGLRILHQGVPQTMQKGKIEIPHPALALSTEPNDYPRCEVDAATALTYLRGEAICIDAPRGFDIITHRGHGLGFVKNLGNRANNLYPDAWRIRSGHGTPCEVLTP